MPILDEIEDAVTGDTTKPAAAPGAASEATEEVLDFSSRTPGGIGSDGMYDTIRDLVSSPGTETLMPGSGEAGIMSTPSAALASATGAAGSGGAIPATSASVRPGQHAIGEGGVINADMLAGTTPAVNPYGQASHYTTSARGHLESLLDQDSSYLQAARTRAAQEANKRGLLNSTMAAGAGELAAIQSALPIAQQDAGQRQQLQQAGYNISSNMQGQFLKHVGQVQTNATQAIASISAAAGIPSDVKAALINNIQNQRDADLQFVNAVYSQASAWDPTWTLIGGSTNPPGVAGGAGRPVSLPALPSGGGSGTISGGGGGTSAGGLGALAGVGLGILDEAGVLDGLFGGGDGGGGGGGGVPGAPGGTDLFGGSSEATTGEFGGTPGETGATGEAGAAGEAGGGTPSTPGASEAVDALTGRPDAFAGLDDLFTALPGSSEMTLAELAGTGGITDIASILGPSALEAFAAFPGLFEAASTTMTLGEIAGFGGSFAELLPTSLIDIGGAAGAGGAGASGFSGSLAGMAPAALAVAFAAPIAMGIFNSVFGPEKNVDYWTPFYDKLPDAVTIPSGHVGAGKKGVPFEWDGKLVYLEPAGPKYEAGVGDQWFNVKQAPSLARGEEGILPYDQLTFDEIQALEEAGTFDVSHRGALKIVGVASSKDKDLVGQFYNPGHGSVQRPKGPYVQGPTRTSPEKFKDLSRVHGGATTMREVKQDVQAERAP